MPIPQTVALRCTQCHWKAVNEEGDVVMPGSLRMIDKCPWCGGEVKSFQPDMLDRLNPANRLRALGTLFNRRSK